MVDFSLSLEQQQIRETVRRFVESELMPFESVLIRREIEGAGASPALNPDELAAVQEKGRALGLWGIDLPEEFGGAALDPVTLAVIHEELGRTFIDFDFGGSVPPALYACNETQKERYLMPTIEGSRIAAIAISEPGGGSDPRAMRTTAVQDGKDWIINGEKTWISRGDFADFAILFARTPAESDPHAITCFLVDRDLGWTSRPIALMGAKDKVGSLYFDNVRVPGEMVLGTVGRGFDHLMPFIYNNRTYRLSAKNLGAMRRLIGLAADWVQERTVFGKKLAERENIAFAIAEMEIELRCAKMLVYHASFKAAEGRDYRHEACAAKLYVARVANTVVDRVLQMHGAMGLAKESVVERWYRDLRVERIYDGADEVNLASVARNIFRGHVSPGELW